MILDLPRYPVAAEIQWDLSQPSQVTESEFARATRVTILSDKPKWTAKVKYPTIRGEQNFLPWRAALARLRGRAGIFRLIACERPQEILRSAGAFVVDGAGQRGTMITTRGWVPGTAMLGGYFVTIADRLYQVLSTAIADGTGRMAIEILPEIGEGVADGTTIEAIQPYAAMSMTEDRAGWTVGVGQAYDIAFDCAEAV